HANEPLYILRELRSLGELDLVAHVGLPPLSELEPDHPYVGWTGTFRTTATRAQIDEVFEFVVGDCELEIVETDPAPLAPVVDEAVAFPAAPLGTVAAPPIVPAEPPSASLMPAVTLDGPADTAPMASGGPSAERADPAPAGRAQPAKPAAT